MSIPMPQVRRLASILLVLSSLVLLPVASSPAPNASASREEGRVTYDKLPVAFVPNAGPTHALVHSDASKRLAGDTNGASNASSQGQPRDELASLPLAAQATISSALGRDDHAYHARPSAGGFRAKNPRHALEVAFTDRGVDVRAGESRLGLTLEAWGYGEALGPLSSAAPRAEANQISYQRGALTEWYVNGPLGLQQGFTLAAPPAVPTGDALTLALALTGDLQASLARPQDGVTLANEGGVPELRYRGLAASDARGRELPAWLELRGRSVLLRVADAGAQYPLSIDPFVEQAKLTASDGAANDLFGVSVAIAGDTIVVGAFGDDIFPTANRGSAYVFVEPAGGWAGALTEQAKLTASDGAMGDNFGFSVAIAGNTIVVGAISDDIGPLANRGSAYVFVKPAGGWAGALTEQAKLLASDGFLFDGFGNSVDIAGNTVVVGATGDNIGAIADQGSAYVFVEPATGWAGTLTEQAKLTASDGALMDTFGRSVAIAGTTVVVGADGDNVGANADQGSAYVFVQPAGGWAGALTEQAKLTASDGAAADLFGFSVDITGITGNTVVVGAFADDVGANVNQGSAYVFVKPAAGWAGALTQQAKLTASDGAPSDAFGFSVAIAGSRVAVGASGDDVVANFNQGSAYVFVRPGGGWAGALTEQAKLIASDGAAFDDFGRSVGIAGETVVVGADAHDVGANVDQGAAYVFGPDGCPPSNDEDNDGLTDANELSLGTLIGLADSDADGTVDGNDDANGNGEDDEDEDDDDPCPDSDSDGDGTDDEDEDDD